jgi:chromosome segregation ATPase
MARCVGLKQNGELCTATVEPPQRYCWWHDPANSEKRRRAASKAARSKSNREIRDLKEQLEDLAERVLSGELETGRAAVANQIHNTRARLIELERKAKETEELAERIERLERAAQERATTARRGGMRW